MVSYPGEWKPQDNSSTTWTTILSMVRYLKLLFHIKTDTTIFWRMVCVIFKDKAWLQKNGLDYTWSARPLWHAFSLLCLQQCPGPKIGEVLTWRVLKKPSKRGGIYPGNFYSTDTPIGKYYLNETLLLAVSRFSHLLSDSSTEKQGDQSRLLRSLSTPICNLYRQKFKNAQLLEAQKEVSYVAWDKNVDIWSQTRSGNMSVEELWERGW